jgi:cobalt-zinc-cadmium efflux system protein
VLNGALVAGQVAGGLVAHSTGLLADAGHNLADTVAVVGAMAAVRVARRPRDAVHSFGHHRATILAALGSVTLTGVVTALIVVEAVHRLLHPAPVAGSVVTAVAGAAFVVNAAGAGVLHDDHHDLNMAATLLHFVADAAASVAVLAAGVTLLVVPTATWADPAAAVVVAAVILVETARLARQVAEVLLEAAPKDVDLDELQAAMVEVDGVADVHDLHVWSLSSDVRALSAHVQVAGHPTLEAAHAVSERVKAAVTDPFGIAHLTIELECERCEDRPDPCDMDAWSDHPTERPRRAATALCTPAAPSLPPGADADRG